MQIIYSVEKVENKGNRRVENPDHFNGVIEGATSVYIRDDYPLVRKAYERANIPVHDISELRSQPVKAEKKAEEPQEDKFPKDK